MKIEALIRILQYCENNNIEIDYKTNENVILGKRGWWIYNDETNKHFTKDKAYMAKQNGTILEIEEDNQGDPHYIDFKKFTKLIKF